MKQPLLFSLLVVALACPAGTLLAKGTPSGGDSAAHVSDQARINSNGPNALNREKGQARAAERRSTQGAAHQKATANIAKHKKKAVVMSSTTPSRSGRVQ